MTVFMGLIFLMSLCTLPAVRTNKLFRGSSAAEQLTVNQLVVGSIPTPGAIKMPPFCGGLLLYLSGTSELKSAIIYSYVRTKKS